MASTNPVRIFLVDDHNLMRAGIRMLLEGSDEAVVVGEASDGSDAVALIKEHRPDVVLMDISIGGLNGLEVTAQIKKELPHIRIIILSMHVSEEYVLQALRAGASGYLVKDAAISELGVAIKAVMRGDTYLSPRASRQVVDSYLHRVGDEAKPPGPLTPRQVEVLRMIASGQATKEIAYALGVSVKTVETHRALLMERLGIHDIAGLVRYAVRTGLVKNDK